MLSPSMKAGDTLGGKYKLVQRLGKGGMGVVWEANHELTGRKVALKLILSPTDDLRMRLRREARACGSLNHPNIVEVYDVSETVEGDPFLVMQFLPGQTLAEMLNKKRRVEPPALAARIARDIASALEAAHGAQIIHRDLKPANIFLRQDSATSEGAFTVKVLDFGVSKFLSGDEGPATVTGMAAGSPAYMSPEQVRIEKGLDPRTDIWSLGIVLYEMLTGVRPFVGKTVEDMVHQVLTAPIPSVMSRVRTVPPELDAIVMRCLERNRDKRMPDAKTLARALDAFLDASASRVSLSLRPHASSGSPGSAGDSMPEGRVPSPGREPGMTTTTTPTVHPGEPGGRTRGPLEGVSSRKRKRSKGAWLYAAVGGGLVLIVAFVAVAVVGLSSIHRPSEALGAVSTPAAPPTVSSRATAPSANEAPPEAEQKLAPAPARSAPPPADLAKAVPPQPTVTPLPTCSRFVRIHCRNASR
jgi:serine/threonine-protein kinase